MNGEGDSKRQQEQGMLSRGESKETMNKGLQGIIQELGTEVKIKLPIQVRIGHIMITSPGGRKSA